MQEGDYKLDLGKRVCCGATALIFGGLGVCSLIISEELTVLVFCLAVPFFLGMALYLVGPLFWRLRLDQQGLTQTLYGFQVSWAWEDLGTGVVEMDDERNFVRTDWPWWRLGRKLALHRALHYEERVKVLEQIRQHCQQTELFDSIEEQYYPWRNPPKKKNLFLLFLRVFLAMAIVFAVASVVLFTLVCLWLLLESALNVRLLHCLEKGDRELVLTVVFCLAFYLCTNRLILLLAKIGLVEPKERTRKS